MKNCSNRAILAAGLLLVGAFSAPAARAEEPDSQKPNSHWDLRDWSWDMAGELGLGGVPTLGGRLFWGDVLHFRGWRIQENVFTHHFRLLGPSDRRFASGSREQCARRLEEIKEEKKLALQEGRAVILIHGMGRSSKSWPRIAGKLREQGAIVVAVDYPSTQCGIHQSADYLHEVIESLDGITEIDIVCHSMGGLVVRAWLETHADERIGRMVMLAVPNLGAEMADIAGDFPLYRWVCGPGGCQLGTDPQGIIADLPTPKFEFAVIAAGRGTDSGYNPLIPGDDDGTVTVASTRLPGAADFLQVDGVMHSFIMYDERVVAATLRFLDSGRLRECGQAEPIDRRLEISPRAEAHSPAYSERQDRP